MNNLFNNLIRFSAIVNKKYESYLDEAILNHGLSQNEARVLLFINSNPENNTAQDISDFRLISKSLVSKSVNELAERNLISIIPDTEDKRVNRLHITEDAKEMVTDLMEGQKLFIDLVEKDFSKKEDSELERLLEKVYKNIKDAD